MAILVFILVSVLRPVPPLGATLNPYHEYVADSATVTKLPARGWATYYGDGIFARVVQNQIRNGNIDEDGCRECIGYAAMLWPDDLGRTVCVNGYGPLWVVDSAAEGDRQALIDKGWLIDIDWNTWTALGFWNGPTLVTVSEC